MATWHLRKIRIISTGKSESSRENKIWGRAEKQGKADGKREMKGKAAGENAKSTAPEMKVHRTAQVS